MGVPTLEELREHNARLVELLDAGTAPVHVLLRSDIEQPPTLRLDVARSVFGGLAHPVLGYVLLINRQKPLVEFVATILGRFFGVKYKFFPTLDEAIAFLKAEDPSIDWSQLDESALSEQSSQ